jgi:hypothetical protein
MWSALAYESEEMTASDGDPDRLALYERMLDTGALRASHALAYGAAHDLGLVELISHRLRNVPLGDAGLLRPAEETANLLDYWLCNVPQAPVPARARRALAWILRSTDQTDSNQWQALYKSAAERSLDLLRRWQERGEAVVRAHAAGLGRMAA